MKETFDKEMDSLLRRRVRAGAEARAGDGASAKQSAAHLDADELSAFAEGALPAGARLAAVSHLADCDECRGLAVGLARAAGAEGVLEKRAAATQVEPARPARWREWLATLFAPRVLRYAAPALALCVVAAVSFVALRSRGGKMQLARQTSSGAPRRPATAQAGEGNEADEGALSSSANTAANANVSVAPSDTAAGESQEEAEGSAARSRAAQTAKGPHADEETQAAPPEEPKRGEAPPANEKESAAAAAPATAANQPSGAAKSEPREKDEDRPAPPPEQAGVTSEQTARQQQAKQRASQNNLDAVVAPDDSRNQTRSANNSSAGYSNSGANNGARAGALASKPAEDRDKTERGGGAAMSRRARSSGESRAQTEDDDVTRAEGTRSAAGHRFRREGGAWVDVNYRPSMPSTGVRRGTDAYRALVADVPEVGRAAEQLGGEVVVVVRGRAYRIR